MHSVLVVVATFCTDRARSPTIGSGMAPIAQSSRVGLQEFSALQSTATFHYQANPAFPPKAVSLDANAARCVERGHGSLRALIPHRLVSATGCSAFLCRRHVLFHEHQGFNAIGPSMLRFPPPSAPFVLGSTSTINTLSTPYHTGRVPCTGRSRNRLAQCCHGPGSRC
jgi:hypothetical protein